MTEHQLKIWPQWFEAVAQCRMTFQVRRDDRSFAVGDVLVLEEFRAGVGEYTGRSCRREVTYVARGRDAEDLKLPPGFCVLGIRKVVGDSGLVAFAKSEMDRGSFSAGDKEVIPRILTDFFDEYDSGGAVYVMAPVLMRLIAGKPLSPLTGADDEWMEVSDGVFQNVRCSSVFKDRRFHDGKLAYDIDAPEPRAAITFPYEPDGARVRSPVMTLETKP